MLDPVRALQARAPAPPTPEHASCTAQPPRKPRGRARPAPEPPARSQLLPSPAWTIIMTSILMQNPNASIRSNQPHRWHPLAHPPPRRHLQRLAADVRNELLGQRLARSPDQVRHAAAPAVLHHDPQLVAVPVAALKGGKGGGGCARGGEGGCTGVCAYRYLYTCVRFCELGRGRHAGGGVGRPGGWCASA